MSMYQSIKNFGKKILLIGGLVAILSGCEKSATSEQYYVDLNNDGRKEIVYAKYAGKGMGDQVWDLCEAGEPPRRLFRLNGTDKFRFEDMDGDGFPEIVFEVYAGKGMGDQVWDVYSVKNNKGNFGKPQKIARLNKD